MAEIDSLGTNTYFSGVQSAASEALRKNRKAEESKKVRKSKFSDILHSTKENEADFYINGLPAEIAAMPIDEAAIFLKDAVDNAGNELAESVTPENIQKFKNSVQQFLRFIVNNNYAVKTRRKKTAFGTDAMVPVPTRTNFFSNYQVPPHRFNAKYQIEVINEKLAALTAATMEGQKDNLALLEKIDEIKGLLIDLMN